MVHMCVSADETGHVSRRVTAVRQRLSECESRERESGASEETESRAVDAGNTNSTDEGL